jgi:hypothetical protein
VQTKEVVISSERPGSPSAPRSPGSAEDDPETLRVRIAELEAELRESHALLASVLESSLSSLMVFKAVRDAAGQVVDFEWLLVNSRALRSTGRKHSGRRP